ncbi:TniB family NTP-binding protein [Novilysobacter arseniciresistens]|uniref:TniB family NTP-binding protein n=1 Tax=Novilysobacter arseniciresistens TaxID=1385522 RepID=UPI001364854F|nr:TniB family NTP-binding protein [Lysobacter arseniciresistens]
MNWAHLDERIEGVAAGRAEKRIAYALADQYVPYGYSEFLISEVAWMVQQNPSRRPKCMLIFGESGCGKSMILNEVVRRFAAPEASAEMPVVSVDLPSATDMRPFFIRVLRALDYPFSQYDRKDVLYDQMVMALKVANTRVLVIDELHNLLLARKGMEECMVTLRDMVNIPLSILSAGTQSARVCVAADDQLKHRFRCHPMGKWKVSQSTRDFVATLESRLPLLKPSNLADKEILVQLVSKCGGHPATIVTVIREAAREAILCGEESIDRGILEKVMTRILAEKYEATNDRA